MIRTGHSGTAWDRGLKLPTGFSWLWAKQRGIVHMYVSRTDRFVWIDCKNGRPWLITPEHPDDFVHVLLNG